jgi:type II secretory pathway pseudopilin PulG
VVSVITLILAGLAALALLAVVVGITDAAGRTTARERAAERRARWEARRLQFHGGVDDGREWDDD